MTTDDSQKRRNNTRLVLFMLIALLVAGSFLAILVAFLIARNPSLVQ